MLVVGEGRQADAERDGRGLVARLRAWPRELMDNLRTILFWLFIALIGAAMFAPPVAKTAGRKCWYVLDVL